MFNFDVECKAVWLARKELGFSFGLETVSATLLGLSI
jgi:hypothetical protein